jgi:hypothetical protein
MFKSTAAAARARSAVIRASAGPGCLLSAGIGRDSRLRSADGTASVKSAPSDSSTLLSVSPRLYLDSHESWLSAARKNRQRKSRL